jgi:exonuclease III
METNMSSIDHYIVNQTLGSSYDGFSFLPADGTRGGILVAWKTSEIHVQLVTFDTHSVNLEIRNGDSVRWWLTAVYGPQSNADKTLFLAELKERRALCPGPWLLLGDFNMILRASEKNNTNLDRTMMNKFREFVAELELKELYMHGRLFTWSNEREEPTLTRIDRALVSVDWDLCNPDALLQALTTNVSDHAPLHLSLSAGFRPKRRFRFEVFWTKLEGFEEAVKAGWTCDDAISDPFLRLNELL